MLDHLGEGESERQRIIDRLSHIDNIDVFNKIAALACDIFDIPTCLITLVGRDKQLIFAKQNFPFDETARETSFCQHVVDDKQQMVINDTHADSRFNNNPLTKGEPFIRFYAGTPLLTKEHIAIGSLCIIDYQPRQTTPAQIQQMEHLAGIVMAFLTESHRLGLVDPVTLLPNRQRLIDEIGLMQPRDGEHTLVLIELAGIADLYDFAKSFGMVAIEERMRQQGQQLAQAFGREFRLFCVAFGRFAVLFPSEKLPVVIAVMERLRKGMNSGKQRFYTLKFHLTVGYTFFTPDRTHGQQVLRESMSALHEALASGEKVMAYHTDNDTTQKKLFILIHDLSRPISVRRGFSLHYQPKFDVAKGEITGAEALIRWQHPVYGNIPPSEFIPLAEKAGYIPAVTRWVIKTVLQQIEHWLSLGRTIKVSANISVQDLTERHFLRLMRNLKADHPQAIAYLELECLETQEIINNRLAIDNLTRLKQQGFTIAIDDFGAGYSNLSYLINLPADVIKIDRSLISNMMTDRRNRIILRHLIKMLHELDYLVIAEGIEDQATFDKLSALGFDLAQGYYISRPLPVGEFERFIQTATPANLNKPAADDVTK